jgi:uncharacterized protein (DUF488 family)
MDIFTIGHSNYSIDSFIDRLSFYSINCIVDIRGTPYSKYNIQFNKEILKKTLTDKGYLYIYMGTEFAAQRNNKDLYTKQGYADFEKVAEDKDFLRGIERLKDGLKKGYRIALMGARQEPINCHRCILLGRFLIEAGFNVRHILDDYTLGSQEEMEIKLIDKYYTHKEQLTFDVLMGKTLSDEEMLKECYRLSNKEIGYRVEKIKNK